MFNYGVSIDPNYPLFYYNIACVYGEKRDMANAIVYLQKALAESETTIRCERYHVAFAHSQQSMAM